MKRHLVTMHVTKNECLPAARIDALLEMAKFGNFTHGGSMVCQNKEGVKREYKGPKEICPKCDKVVLYLSTHLIRTHKLQNSSEENKTLMFMARRYKGKSNELKWDKKIILSNTKTKKKRLPTRSRRPSSNSDEDQPLNPLALLAEEDLPEDTSEESFHDLEEAVPLSPQPGPRSIMTAQPQGRADFNVEDSLQENEHKTEEEKELKEEEEQEQEKQEEQEEEEEKDVGEGNKESYKTWRSFYQSATGRTVMEHLLIAFCKHLQNILGRCKSERDAIQHAQNVRRCLTSIDPITAPSSLQKDGGLLVWKAWAKPHLHSKKV